MRQGRRVRRRRTDAAGPRLPLELARFDPDDWPGLTPEQAAAQWTADREQWHRAHSDSAGRSLLGDGTDLFAARREARLIAARPNL